MVASLLSTTAPGTSNRRDLAGFGNEPRALATTEISQAGLANIIEFLPEVGTGRLLYAAMFKHAIDVVSSVVMLALLSPLLLIIFAAIRLDSSGPAIFTQNRVGRGGRTFKIYKFRTMRHDPSGQVVWLTDTSGIKRHKLQGDPRVTSVGRLLRRTSLDELPQLFNVIRGDMSLVGPRPELPEIVDGYAPWQHERHVVRPGLTGWWQVSGRSNLLMHENTGLDIYYVRNLSLSLDARIVLRSIRVVLRGTGAF